MMGSVIWWMSWMPGWVLPGAIQLMTIMAMMAKK